jgi:hypothetical protein
MASVRSDPGHYPSKLFMSRRTAVRIWSTLENGRGYHVGSIDRMRVRDFFNTQYQHGKDATEVLC